LSTDFFIVAPSLLVQDWASKDKSKASCFFATLSAGLPIIFSLLKSRECLNTKEGSVPLSAASPCQNKLLEVAFVYAGIPAFISMFIDSMSNPPINPYVIIATFLLFDIALRNITDGRGLIPPTFASCCNT
jgi:hypothetical protein